ncbi:hypothetical protein K1T35_47800 (plasmid) [Pseudonocardia sp. DSM 110487]|uniref:hypothetical protein n=1 Tax=Pseudonocardia sp. DSM 110487 TaxID=2865833 RepID=UPI001C6A8E1B|nr:hypothetical protein [Pseudonocardia sp. DSM 110487]QYN41056.1 hypothetical protein K1T35_47800 [Pseudonocardia sp. DSM 110487]
MPNIVSIAGELLDALATLGTYLRVHRRAGNTEPARDLLRAGQHPAPTPYEPGAAYPRTAGITGGGAL